MGQDPLELANKLDDGGEGEFIFMISYQPRSRGLNPVSLHGEGRMTNDYGSPPHPAFAVQDAFVQLVVSTYKDAARLVSNVGEHSAIFAPLGPKPEKVETLNLPE